ncbi:hypothetical protein Taro_051276 [Colocasia esculenta]|uniref:Uncharacterized protein n=1 Tax=Colocasia esculenta TaxID=4460 RepID=A0A843XFJ2_COLES|nr:hypothetical protein [Colocasia esculenta]
MAPEPTQREAVRQRTVWSAPGKNSEPLGVPDQDKGALQMTQRRCPTSFSPQLQSPLTWAAVMTREPNPRPTPGTRFSQSPPTDPGTQKGYNLRLTGYAETEKRARPLCTALSTVPMHAC